MLEQKLCAGPRWLVALFAIKGLLPAVAWLLSGWMILFVIAYALASREIWALASMASVITLYLSTFVLTASGHRWLHRLAGKGSGVRWISVIRAAWWLLPTLILHSVPPIASLVAKVHSMWTGRKPYKPKTED